MKQRHRTKYQTGKHTGASPVRGKGNDMVNHPNRSQTPQAIAQAAGYSVREGSYVGATDDRAGRWYVAHNGECRPFGPGYPTRAAAWLRAAELATEAEA